ncbi:MAG: hypothetical protein EBW96_01650 [Actinobacteria bacterium]|nr:hypothetical protein [Actinomycetota bacterium]
MGVRRVRGGEGEVVADLVSSGRGAGDGGAGLVAGTVLADDVELRLHGDGRTRAIGEYPKAAGTLGVDVNKLRYRNLMLAGAVAGVGGAWWPIGIVGRFDQNITAGRGFIALAAVIFGRWHPVGALCGALVFALAEAVRLKIGNFDTGIPSEFLIMAPYVVTIIVVAGFIGASRAPKAAGQPYDDQ